MNPDVIVDTTHFNGTALMQASGRDRAERANERTPVHHSPTWSTRNSTDVPFIFGPAPFEWQVYGTC